MTTGNDKQLAFFATHQPGYPAVTFITQHYRAARHSPFSKFMGQPRHRLASEPSASPISYLRLEKSRGQHSCSLRQRARRLRRVGIREGAVIVPIG